MRGGSTNFVRAEKTKFKTNSNGNTLSKNNNYEEERCSSTSRSGEGYAERNQSKQKRSYQPPTSSRATAAAAGLLESEFQAIDLEVKNSILGAGECRQREDDVSYFHCLLLFLCILRTLVNLCLRSLYCCTCLALW